MRIMFILPKMTGGGAERMVANLSNYFCRENEVRIVTIASKKSFYKLDDRVKLCGRSFVVNRKNIFTTLICYVKNFPKSMKFIKNQIKDFNPDCVVSFLFETDVMTHLSVGNNNRIVKVFSERNDPTRKSLIKRWILKRIYRKADLFVCQSKKVYDYYSCVPKEKKVIIPNSLDSKSLPKPVLTEKNSNIVTVGRLFPQKNTALLIKSFILSVKQLPKESNLIIFGDGPLKEELQSIVLENGMEDRIKLAGASNNVLEEIKDAALFVLPSNYEGFPNALLEAMAVGLPVISTDFYTGIARDLIDDKNGIVVPVGSEEELSKAICKLMSNKEMRTKMRKENIYVREKYDTEKIILLWVECITNSIKKKGKA